MFKISNEEMANRPYLSLIASATDLMCQCR
jgi:hypothetical protein